MLYLSNATKMYSFQNVHCKFNFGVIETRSWESGLKRVIWIRWLNYKIVQLRWWMVEWVWKIGSREGVSLPAPPILVTSHVNKHGGGVNDLNHSQP